MYKNLISKISKRISNFLTVEIEKPRIVPLSDFNILLNKIEVCDVVLVEGRSRSARVITWITRSIWTHSALSIGTLESQSAKVKSIILDKYPDISLSCPLLIESQLGMGVIVSSLQVYELDHLRICRPSGISEDQKKQVILHAVQEIGLPYDARQIFDLARFFFPWRIVPRRWQSTLFKHNIQKPTKYSCSLLIAMAFLNAEFPIVERHAY